MEQYFPLLAHYVYHRVQKTPASATCAAIANCCIGIENYCAKCEKFEQLARTEGWDIPDMQTRSKNCPNTCECKRIESYASSPDSDLGFGLFE